MNIKDCPGIFRVFPYRPHQQFMIDVVEETLDMYQDFGTYVRTIPTRCSDIRASWVNNLDAIISKTFVIRERVRIQYRRRSD